MGYAYEDLWHFWDSVGQLLYNSLHNVFMHIFKKV